MHFYYMLAFIHVKTLRWHIYRQHGGEKPFKCAICTEGEFKLAWTFAQYFDLDIVRQLI